MGSPVGYSLKDAIVITGTPGVGKTTAARELARCEGYSLIELNQLAKEIGAISGEDTERGAALIDEVKLRSELRRILTGGGRKFLVEGHYGEIVPSGLVKMAIVVRLDPRVLRQRLAERGYHPSKVKENVQAELLDACLISAVETFGAERVFEVDATGLGVPDLVAKIRDAIRGRGEKAGRVNWVEQLHRDGALQEFLG